MIKKKLSILLSLSLAVLFISLLGTTSYASLTDIDIKNFILNSYAYDFSTNSYDSDKVTTVMTFLENHTTEINSLVSYSDQENANYILMKGPTTLGTASNTTSLLIAISQDPFYSPGDGNYLYTTSGKLIVKANIKLSTNNFTLGTSGSSWSGYSTTWVKYYSQGDVYTDNTYTNIKYASGSHPSGLLTSPYYTGNYFTFLINSNLNTITINGDIVPYIEHNTNQATTYVLGELGLANNFYNAELFTYRWQQGSWKLQNIRTLENIGPSSDNLIEVTIRGDWINPNTLYSLQMNPYPDSEFAPYSQPFFVKNRFTSITNGVLDLDNTFSGDYYNNYNNDTNTQDIINNTNDNDNVDNIIDTQLSGDVNDFASKVGYNPIQNPFIHVIEFLLNGICNTVLGSGDVTLDFSFRGVNWVLDSSDLTTPTNALTTFMSVLLSALYVFAFYKYGFHVYEKLQEGDITSVINSSHDDNNWRYM